MKALAGLIAAFVVLASVYNVAVPLWEASDEPRHFEYVRYVAAHRALPQPPPVAVAPRDESDQQPLYYVIQALATGWIDTPEQPLWRLNPYLGWSGEPTAHAIALHTEDEQWPYRGVVLAAHAARAVSSLMGLVTILFTYLLARRVFDSRWLALAAAAFTAFTPGFVFSSATINNDSAVTTLSTIALWALVSLLKPGRGTRHNFVLCGLTMGAAAISKGNGLFLLPVSILALVFQVIKGCSIRNVANAVAYTLGPFVLLAIPFYLRNLTFFPQTNALDAFAIYLVGPAPFQDISWSLIQPMASSLFQSYWGVFGWQNGYLSAEIYLALALLSIVALGGLVSFLVRPSGWRRERRATKQALVLLGTGALVMIGIVGFRFLIAPYSGYDHGRFLYPSLAGFSILFVQGLRWAIPTSWRPWILSAIGGVLLLLSVMAPFTYIMPAYPPPLPVRTNISPNEIPNYAPTSFANGLQLLGHSASPRKLHPGDTLKLTLYWGVQETPRENYIAFVQLLNRSREAAASDDRIPLEELYPMRMWRAGEVIREERTITIAHEARPGVYWVTAGLYRYPSVQRVPAAEDGRTEVVLDWVKVTKTAPPSPQHRLQAVWANSIELLGYDLDLLPGRLAVTLHWQARSPMAENVVVVFAHLLDSNGRLLAQHDSEPSQGNYPTSFWEAGEEVQDRHEIALPQGLPPGEYRLVVGAYHYPSLERLPVQREGAESLQESLELGSIQLGGLAP